MSHKILPPARKQNKDAAHVARAEFQGGFDAIMAELHALIARHGPALGAPKKEAKGFDLVTHLKAIQAGSKTKDVQPKPGPLADGRQGMADMLFNVDPTLGLALAKGAAETKAKNYKKYEGK